MPKTKGFHSGGQAIEAITRTTQSAMIGLPWDGRILAFAIGAIGLYALLLLAIIIKPSPDLATRLEVEKCTTAILVFAAVITIFYIFGRFLFRLMNFWEKSQLLRLQNERMLQDI